MTAGLSCVKGLKGMSFEVTEIFESIQGESSYSGLRCTFVRLSGCNLRCRYCDSTYAFEPGEKMTQEEVLERISRHKPSLVEITGGEPLLQEDTPKLAAALLDMGITTLVETNGSLDVSVLPSGAARIMDIKCPSSGQTDAMRWDNLWKLDENDEVKFVIADRHDYEWARGIIGERFALLKTGVLMSTVFGELPPWRLVDWMLEDKLPARFQIQMHKYVWPHDRRGV
jgi:7-carboxy-7-deazaguanine synthase